MTELITVDPGDISIPESVIAGRLGFLGEKTIPDRFRDDYLGSLALIRENAFPRALIEDHSVVFQDSTPFIDGRELPGELARKHLDGSDRVTLLLATIGKDVDEIIQNKSSILSSFMLDGIASEFVEFFVRGVDTILRKRYPDRIGRTRISPGYGDLPLELNDWMVALLGGKDMGVSCVPDSYQLLPRKTVSAMIGWRCQVEK